MKQAKEFLENIIRGIVYRPDSVRVEVDKDDMGVLMRVWVHKNDMGLLIGKAGVNSKALVLITKLYGFCHKLKISIKFEEPN